jgi:hypothetical protein
MKEESAQGTNNISFRVEWKDVETSYSLLIAEDSLIYKRELRYGGHIAVSAVGAAQLAYAKAKDKRLAGEEDILIPLRSVTRVAIETRPYYGYSSFRNVLATFTGLFCALIYTIAMFYMIAQFCSHPSFLLFLAGILLNIPILYLAGRAIGFVWARVFSRRNLLLYRQSDKPAFQIDIDKLDQQQRRGLLNALKQFASVSQDH